MMFRINSRAGTADYSLAKTGVPEKSKTYWGGKENCPVLSELPHYFILPNIFMKVVKSSGS